MRLTIGQASADVLSDLREELSPPENPAAYIPLIPLGGLAWWVLEQIAAAAIQFFAERCFHNNFESVRRPTALQHHRARRVVEHLLRNYQALPLGTSPDALAAVAPFIQREGVAAALHRSLLKLGSTAQDEECAAICQQVALMTPMMMVPEDL